MVIITLFEGVEGVHPQVQQLINDYGTPNDTSDLRIFYIKQARARGNPVAAVALNNRYLSDENQPAWLANNIFITGDFLKPKAKNVVYRGS